MARYGNISLFGKAKSFSCWPQRGCYIAIKNLWQSDKLGTIIILDWFGNYIYYHVKMVAGSRNERVENKTYSFCLLKRKENKPKSIYLIVFSISQIN